MTPSGWQQSASSRHELPPGKQHTPSVTAQPPPPERQTTTATAAAPAAFVAGDAFRSEWLAARLDAVRELAVAGQSVAAIARGKARAVALAATLRRRAGLSRVAVPAATIVVERAKHAVAALAARTTHAELLAEHARVDRAAIGVRIARRASGAASRCRARARVSGARPAAARRASAADRASASSEADRASASGEADRPAGVRRASSGLAGIIAFIGGVVRTRADRERSQESGEQGRARTHQNETKLRAFRVHAALPVRPPDSHPSVPTGILQRDAPSAARPARARVSTDRDICRTP
jgi:hypothetical protein